MDEIDQLLAQRAGASIPVAPSAPVASAAQADDIDALLSARAESKPLPRSYVYSEDLGAQDKGDLPRVEVSGTNAPRSLPAEIGHQVGLTARAGISGGIMGIPNMLGDALNTGINLGTTGINKVFGTEIPQLKMPSQATQDMLDSAGFAKPENDTERVVQDITSAMAGAKGNVQLGKFLAQSSAPTTKAIGEGLQEFPGLQIVGGAGAGAGSGIARELGFGPIGQLAGGLIGGGIGAGASSGITRLANRGESLPVAPSRVEPQLTEAQAAPKADKPRIKLNIDGTAQELVSPSLPVPSSSVSVPAFSSPAQVETVPARALDTSKLTKAEQRQRIETLKKIGLEEQRPSLYTGDQFRAAQEFQTSRLDNPTGKMMQSQLEKEQTALKNYAYRIVESAGGTQGGDMVTRGTAITAPLNALSEHLDNQITALYKAADAKSNGTPNIQLSGLNNLLETNSVFAGKSENGTLRRGIRAYMKEHEIAVDGKLQPINAETAEGLRQYLNSQWSPANQGLIRRIKDTIDLDVTGAVGKDAYESARKLHAARKDTLDNPNGIASILKADGPDGINRIVPDEKVASKTVSMPAAQFRHVIKTLQSMPTPELQAQAQQAINEIRQQMAEQIYAAGAGSGKGAWNASSVTKTLESLRPKLGLVFSKDELEQLRALNDAGHILHTDRSYPGAAAQGYNMLQSGAIKLGPYIGGGVGMVTGTGPVAGALAGKGVSSVVQGWADKNNAKKLAEMLRNPAPK